MELSRGRGARCYNVGEGLRMGVGADVFTVLVVEDDRRSAGTFYDRAGEERLPANKAPLAWPASRRIRRWPEMGEIAFHHMISLTATSGCAEKIAAPTGLRREVARC